MTTSTSEISAVSPSMGDLSPSAVGYAAVRFNAIKHGILSRYVVLSHESAEDYQSLVNALFQEHLPAGATEQHLIEELASVIWRKRRVLQAEGATINQGLKNSARSPKTVVPAAAPFERGFSGEHTDIPDMMDMTSEEVAERQRDTHRELAGIRKAGARLRMGGANAYDRALRALVPDSRHAWQDSAEDGEYVADAEGLKTFIREMEPVCVELEREARHHEAVKNQTLGEGLQAYRLEKLSRYETHLDRKFERTLAMLIKLKDLRRG
jgi:hypothetical protein